MDIYTKLGNSYIKIDSLRWKHDCEFEIFCQLKKTQPVTPLCLPSESKRRTVQRLGVQLRVHQHTDIVETRCPPSSAPVTFTKVHLKRI